MHAHSRRTSVRCCQQLTSYSFLRLCFRLIERGAQALGRMLAHASASPPSPLFSQPSASPASASSLASATNGSGSHSKSLFECVLHTALPSLSALLQSPGAVQRLSACFVVTEWHSHLFPSASASAPASASASACAVYSAPPDWLRTAPLHPLLLALVAADSTNPTAAVSSGEKVAGACAAAHAIISSRYVEVSQSEACSVQSSWSHPTHTTLMRRCVVLCGSVLPEKLNALAQAVMRAVVSAPSPDPTLQNRHAQALAQFMRCALSLFVLPPFLVALLSSVAVCVWVCVVVVSGGMEQAIAQNQLHHSLSTHSSRHHRSAVDHFPTLYTPRRCSKRQFLGHCHCHGHGHN